MATVLTHKKSSTSGHVPSTSQLALGELAINTVDGYIYLKVDDGVTEEIRRIRGTSLTEVSILNDTFTGDGSTTVFNLSGYAPSDQFSFVTINGISQHIDAYSINGGVLTFSEAPDNGDNIEVRTFDLNSTQVQIRDYASYVYTISGDTTSISGADDNGDTLVYDLGKVEVYYNGAKLVPGSDFTASDGSTITLGDTVTTGDTIEVVSLSKASFIDTQTFKPFSTDASTTNQQLVDKFEVDDYRSAKYLVQMTNGTDYHVTEVLLMHDGTDTYITEYGTMYTNNSLGTISADIINNFVRLLVTPANTSTTTVKGHRITVTI
jgi:hypothetical protein